MVKQLPLEADARYFPDFIKRSDADALFEKLLHAFDWSFEVPLQGQQSLKTAFGKINFVDEAIFNIGGLHSGHGKIVPYFTELSTIRNNVEELTGKHFQVCVGIFYPSGAVGMDFHRDLPSFGDTSVIASVSLGAVRKFQLRALKDGRITEQALEHGSLIIMGQGIQNKYEHALIRDASILNARINLTFRQFGY